MLVALEHFFTTWLGDVTKLGAISWLQALTWVAALIAAAIAGNFAATKLASEQGDCVTGPVQSLGGACAVKTRLRCLS